jgi:peptidoglycan-N-acetylmuramic acid deacetylase
MTVLITVMLIIPMVTGCNKKIENQYNTSTPQQKVVETKAAPTYTEKVQPSAANKPSEENNKISEKKPDVKKSEISEQKTTISDISGYNYKYSWSFVRKKDHLPPAFEKKEAELANKYKAIYLGDITKKVIYLTFDEGYENGFTPKILDTLKENNVKAAFFITMPYLKNEYDLVDRMVKEGHTVGNHTVHHPSMPEITDDKKLEDEMLVLDALFKEKTGKQMQYLRPPKGEYSERTLKISKDLGYRNVFWSLAYADWDVNKQKGPDNAYNMVKNNIHNGAVILLHAVSKDNAEALDQIIKDLKAQGYAFETLDQL